MGTIQIDGSTPKLTIGNATAEDALIVFDGNAQDFYIGLDDSADDLVIGLGSAAGTTPAISINEDRDVTISDGAIDFDVASHDTSNGLKLGGTLVTATAAELNIMDGVTSTAAEINLIDGGTARGTTALADGDGILINDAGTMRMTNVTAVKTYMGLAVGDITGATALDDVPATTDEFIINDGGTLKRIDAGFVANYPIFHLYKAGTTSFANDTTTQLVPTSVVRNDDSVYDTSNGRFTVQTNQDGMYFFYGAFRIDNYDPNRCSAVFFVNGSEISYTLHEHSPEGDLTSRRPTIHATTILNLAADDYVEFKGHQGGGSTSHVINAVFLGFKIGG